MESEIVDILGRLGMLLDPAMGAHIAHAMEMRSVFNGNGRSSDIPDEDALFEDLDSFCGSDGPVNLSTGEQRAGGNDSFDHGKLPHNQCAGGMYFTFQFPVDADGAVEIHDAFELNPFPKKGEIVVVRGG